MGLFDMLKKVFGENTDTSSKEGAGESKSAFADKSPIVYVSDKGKSYHIVDKCGRSSEMAPITEAEAIGRGLCKCQACFSGYNEEIFRNEKILNILECSLVGCVYPNADGTSRQRYLVKCKSGENVFFKPAPTKEYPDTIGVFTKKGGCIGVLPYKTLNELRGLYANNKAEVIIKEVTHSDRGLGCIIKITIYK